MQIRSIQLHARLSRNLSSLKFVLKIFSIYLLVDEEIGTPYKLIIVIIIKLFSLRTRIKYKFINHPTNIFIFVALTKFAYLQLIPWKIRNRLSNLVRKVKFAKCYLYI